MLTRGKAGPARAAAILVILLYEPTKLNSGSSAWHFKPDDIFYVWLQSWYWHFKVIWLQNRIFPKANKAWAPFGNSNFPVDYITSWSMHVKLNVKSFMIFPSEYKKYFHWYQWMDIKFISDRNLFHRVLTGDSNAILISFDWLVSLYSYWEISPFF